MERLKRRTDFRAVATGARAPASTFVLQARSRAEGGPPRVGFTVSKQVGNAVERNRVRRRLREIVRLAGDAALQPGHDYVLIGRRTALAAPFAKMLTDLHKGLCRIHESAPHRRGTAGGGSEQFLHPKALSSAGENAGDGTAGRNRASKRPADNPARSPVKSPE